MKLVPGCDCKFSVGRIQTGHADLLPLQVCGRLWQGFRFGDYNCLLQLIDLLNLKSPLGSLFKTSFVDCWLVCIIFIYQRSFILKYFLRYDYKLSVARIQTVHMYLLYPQVCGRSWWGWRFLISTISVNTFIVFKVVPQIWHFLVDCWRLI